MQLHTHFYERNDSDHDYWSALRRSAVELYFVGASVSAQKLGWADRLHSMLAGETGHAHLISKNVMGGVGLLYGCANYEVSTFKSQGRIVFIEFSTGDVNAGLTPSGELKPLLSALIERILLDEGMPIIVHNWRGDFKGQAVCRVREQYDEVAKAYAVPVIYNNRLVDSITSNGSTEESKYFRDVCHTTLEGAELYANHVVAVLKDLSRATTPDAVSGDPRRKLLGGGKLPRAVTMPRSIYARHHCSDGSFAHPASGEPLNYVEVSTDGPLCFRLSGRLMGIGFISGPRAGWVNLSIDGKFARKFGCFDPHSYYERYILLPSVFNCEGSELEIGLSEEAVDFSIAKKSHPDFDLPRRLKLVHLVGNDLVIVPSGS